MTSPTPATLEPALRRHWLAVLARAPAQQLAELLPPALPERHMVRACEVGMLMLRARAGGSGEAFNLGEASVTRCALRLGNGPLGVGYTLGRDRPKAELIAVFDALLQDPLRHAELFVTVIEPLAAAQAQEREADSRAAAESKVEFFTFVRGEA
jgi:alpha-D-ribose 1-methylphosphonate 5-triphosphate synthase subunit PhnG